MLRQFLMGGAVSLCNIVVHALVMTTLVRVVQRAGTRNVSQPFLNLAGVMTAAVSVLLVAHVIEVIVWAVGYWIVGAAPPGANLVYFAFVNYTTLGYGDVVPTTDWQLLGPMTAMNGILLFGWSTAVIFEVLRRAMALQAAGVDGRDS